MSGNLIKRSNFMPAREGIVLQPSLPGDVSSSADSTQLASSDGRFIATPWSGTPFKFIAPHGGNDTMLRNGVFVVIHTRLQCITAMKEYENKSYEELREEDYAMNRRSGHSVFADTSPYTAASNFAIGPAETTTSSDSLVLRDTMNVKGLSANIHARHQNATCLREYENKSFEEIREEIYSTKRKSDLSPFGSFFGSTSPFIAPPSNTTSANSFDNSTPANFHFDSVNNAFGSTKSFGQSHQNLNTAGSFNLSVQIATRSMFQHAFGTSSRDCNSAFGRNYQQHEVREESYAMECKSSPCAFGSDFGDAPPYNASPPNTTSASSSDTFGSTKMFAQTARQIRNTVGSFDLAVQCGTQSTSYSGNAPAFERNNQQNVIIPEKKEPKPGRKKKGKKKKQQPKNIDASHPVKDGIMVATYIGKDILKSAGSRQSQSEQFLAIIQVNIDDPQMGHCIQNNVGVRRME